MAKKPSQNKIDINNVLISPRVTEKGTITVSDSNAYIFNVYPKANKSQISKAFEDKYKIKPIKVAVVNIPAKKVMAKGKRGRTNHTKKAYVYLKKGETISII